MSNPNDAPQGGDGQTVVESQQQPASTQPPPKSDAEAEQQEAERQAAAQQPQQSQQNTEDGKGGKKQNRTGDYIRRLQEENRSFRARLEAIEKQQPKPDTDAKPTREQFDFDESKYEPALEEWRIRQAAKRMAEQQQTNEAQRQQQERYNAYIQRIEEFSDSHPDFSDVVGGISVQLSPELQLAIMGHESGPEIAYFLGLNEDEAVELALSPQGMEELAVKRLVKRMKAAQQPAATDPQTRGEPAQPTTQAATLAGGQVPSRTPVTTQAPPPVPTVGGRAPVEVPPEKMTDDDWYKRDVERRRKR